MATTSTTLPCADLARRTHGGVGRARAPARPTPRPLLDDDLDAGLLLIPVQRWIDRRSTRTGA